MQFTFFLEDLNEGAKEQICRALRERFWPGIEEDAELLGMSPDELVNEQIDHHLNCNHVGFVVEV